MRKLSPESFTDQYISTARPGDRMLHGMLFPAVYPTDFDQDLHRRIRAGEQAAITNPFMQVIRKLITANVTVGRLRVLPRPGTHGCDAEDIKAMRVATQLYTDASGLDCRIADYGQSVALLRRNLGGTSELLARYVLGAAAGEPQSCFWDIRHSNARRPRAVSIMHYTHHVFDGHMIYDRPVDQEIQDYVDCWRDIYEQHAEQLAPQLQHQ